MTRFHEDLAIAGVGVIAAITYAIIAIRNRDCDPPFARISFITASLALGIALLVFFNIVAPVIGYGLICLTLASFQLADLLQDERARSQQRRAAMLAPRPAAEVAPMVWIALAVATGLMLVPYIVLDVERAAAIIVAFCVFLTAGIAWRIASAPRQLFGNDVENERFRDRYSRTRKSGVTAVVAMGTIMVFIVVVNHDVHSAVPLLETLQNVSWWTWALSAVSVIAYCTYLGRQSSSTP